jgi:hypothetical protein
MALLTQVGDALVRGPEGGGPERPPTIALRSPPRVSPRGGGSPETDEAAPVPVDPPGGGLVC